MKGSTRLPKGIQIRPKLLRIGGFRLLFVMPHGWAYGHLSIDVLKSLQLAKREKALVYFVRPRRPVNEALFHVRSDEVTVLAGPTWLEVTVRLLWVASLRMHRKFTYLFGGYTLSKRLGRNSRAASARGDVEGIGVATDGPSYRQRLLIRDPISVRLSRRQQQLAEREASKLGITSNTRVVTLHVREAGFKRTVLGKDEDETGSVRNARIESYLPAVDHLVGEGYSVVRIGDATMTPVSRPGVVDLATSEQRTDLLELYCLMRSEFLISGESGPFDASHLTNTPCLMVNATDPVGSYPVRADGLYVLKQVVDRRTGRSVSLSGMLTEEYFLSFRDPSRYEYVDNTDHEILEAVREMISMVRGELPEAQLQTDFRELVSRRADELRDRVSYIRKWGPQDGFLGDGRIASFFVERHLHPPKKDESMEPAKGLSTS